MARRGGRGTDRGAGGPGVGGRGADDPSESGVWALGEYEWDDDADRPAPPWEQDNWEDSPDPRDRPGGARGGLNVGLAGSQLSGGHPSGPLPPVRGRRARPGSDDYPTAGFQAGPPTGPQQPVPGRRARPGEDHPTGGFPAGPPSGPQQQVRGRRARPAGDDYPTGGFGTGGFPIGDFRTGEWPAGDAPAGESAARDYPTGGFAAGDGTREAGTHGTGPYRAGSGSAGDYSPGARATGGRAQPRATGVPAGDPYAADPYGEDGYEDDEYEEADGYADDYVAEAEDDWYEEADDEQDWADDEDEDDEDEDEAFLPGVTTVYATRAGEQGRAGRRGGSGPGGARGKGRGKSGRGRGRRRTGLWVALSILLVVLLGGGAGAYVVVWPKLFPPDYSGSGSGSVIVHIGSGDNATTIGQILQQDGVVASARAFHNAAVANTKSTGLQPGVYQLHKHMQASLALNMLLSPASLVVYKVTIPEGLRLSVIIDRLGKATHNLAGYQAAIKQVSQLGLPSYANGKPEGFLFPDTYEIQPSTPPIKVLQEMVAEFKKQVSSLNLPKLAAHDGMTQQQIVTLASLIQAEGNGADFGKVSRTIYNRLNQWNPAYLGLDSTIMYALNTYGLAATSAQSTAAAKSPYDTYTHPGLPPGPIDSPGAAALNAALHPSGGNWLYFLTVDPKTGRTLFTASQSQFNAWKTQYGV